jgi:hypothetical protein
MEFYDSVKIVRRFSQSDLLVSRSGVLRCVASAEPLSEARSRGYNLSLWEEGQLVHFPIMDVVHFIAQDDWSWSPSSLLRVVEKVKVPRVYNTKTRKEIALLIGAMLLKHK